ncbi:hypothetical protein NQD34_002808 [Periophthalmus magnuspinnatus]|nr:hypothetical protein NQD34_002808 [Periophthalmus magnuspinnatus]
MMATAAEEISSIHTDRSSAPARCPDRLPAPELCVVDPLSVRLRQQERSWRQRWVYLQCYFLTIATILGTGILGLPVTIAHAGLLPFLVSFLVGFSVQALLIYLFVDLLQRCQVIQLETLKTGVAECIVMSPMGTEPQSLTDDEEEDDGENTRADTGLLYPSSSSAPPPHPETLQPHLHMLGRLFLPRPMSHAFDCILLFHFISIGISYVLAGSEAYASLLNIKHIYIIPVFTWILSLSILLAHRVIQPITSVLTLLKGVLLIVTVAVTFAVGSEVGLHSNSDFSQMGRPFLMGTVALGGIVNVMPMLFSQISHSKTQILWFRRAVLGGLTTCTVLNILWCWAVLEIVPQTTVQSSDLGQSTPEPSTLLLTNVSLEQSEKDGEIATIPLTKIIEESYSVFSWVAVLIQVFISISVTVSFLVMGSALKHTEMSSVKKNVHLSNCCLLHSLVKGLLCLLGFTIIFIVSMCDPKGFVVILDKVVSFSLNTEVGLFVFFMLRESREEQYQSVNVPLPVGDCVFSLSWLLPCYFLFAVVYDVLQTVADLLPLLPHSHWALNHTLALSWTAYNSSGLL